MKGEYPKSFDQTLEAWINDAKDIMDRVNDSKLNGNLFPT